MPADITGTEVLEEDSSGARTMRFIPGPIFANVLLADEINRTPPKTQSALLEAMQEHQVTAAGRRYPLDEPFFVLATQNPIEMEGTYPLPEAQLDRFMFNVLIEYLSEDDETRVVTQTTSERPAPVQPLFNGQTLLEFHEIVRRVPIAEEVARYAVRLAAASRPGQAGTPDFINEYVSWGAGLRAGQFLVLGGKAQALLDGRTFVSTRDLQAIAKPVLRHRILPNYRAEAKGVSVDSLIDRLLEVVSHPKNEAVH
jgi:MoxR-like ATPase